MSKHFHSYLALGDSYTVGEGLPLYESFPYQAVQMLRSKSHHFYAPEIVAKTGWTTFELAEHILHNQLNEKYDFVTLLIGVNNQYRNLLQADYKNDFEFLLKKAIHFTGDRPGKVIVLSIPDWGVSPFAEKKNPPKIAGEIDAFNAINKALSEKYGACYIDITVSGRRVGGEAIFFAEDKLHPSGKQYTTWAMQLSDAVDKMIHK